MNDAKRLGIGLHVCKSVERTADGNLAGIDCDQDIYSSMDILYAAIIGRPTTVHREIRFLLNGSIVDKLDCGSEYLVVYSHPLDERFLGAFRMEYWENGCRYWSRSFSMGTCPFVPKKPEIEVRRLVELLHKFKMV